VRGAMLLPLCALLVHQLRFYLAFGRDAPMWLARGGHSYMSSAEPIALLIAALAVGGFVGRLARCWQQGGEPGGTEPRRGRFLCVWALCAAVLFAVYCGQELIESALAVGHPAGLAGILGHGGWLAAPLAMLVAAALAATLRVAGSLVAVVARARRRPGRHLTTLVPRHAVPDQADWRLHPRAGVAAGRAPPLVIGT
jgi:hypothetical protein